MDPRPARDLGLDGRRSSPCPYAVLSAAVLLWHRRLLDVLAVGDEEASTLGVPVARVRLLVVAAATLGTATAVAFSGLIAFVGIIVPHAIRLHGGDELPDRAPALARGRGGRSSCSPT